MRTRKSRWASLLAAVLITITSTAVAPEPVDAATRPVRLEAGAHSGIKFSSTGAVLQRKNITISSPAMVTTDRRRVVPNRSGIFLRISSGSLAGWEIRESMLAYIPGKVGDTAYSPAATVTFAAGRYLGYRFDTDWGLGSTVYRSLASSSSAKATRRAVIDGRPYVLMSSGIWSGTWMPVTAPRKLSAQRITCSVPAKVAPGSSQVLRRVATTDKEIALTFDMGGRLTPALDIVERLIMDRVCTTIMPTGSSASTTEGRKVMALIAAHPELFEMSNHTQNHCNLRDGGGGSACPSTPPTTARIQQELKEAETVIRTLTGMEAVPYWRPPYGAYDTRVREAAAAIGYTKTLMWDIDTIDWRPVKDGGPTARAIADKVVTNAQTGSIVLMHLGGYNTFDALPSMVSRLRANGLQPTTISALLR
jgi:peptidoglycan/xylan/chitin deacetylase (PgdA/CDA1 family)